ELIMPIMHRPLASTRARAPGVWPATTGRSPRHPSCPAMPGSPLADQSAPAAGRPRATADNLILSYGEANFPLPVGTNLKEDAQIMTTPSLTLRPGDQLASTSCTTRVVVVRVPADRTPVLECGGSPMVAATAGAKPAPPAPGAATLIGK